MICKVISAGICGIDAYEICVEADVAGGLPSFKIVGLPSSEVKESKERVERAIVNSGFDFPSRRITINLSPANIRKQGSGLDLPIAVSILAASGMIHPDALENKIFVGELSLDGQVNPVRGVLPVAIMADEKKVETLVVPETNAFEGAVIDGVKMHGVKNLRELVSDLNHFRIKDVEHVRLENMLERTYSEDIPDYSDIAGQEKAKRATMIAVAGFHNILYVGPPGAGKSMMAQRIPGILNCMTKSECLEVSKIYSISGLLKDDSLVLTRPFRNPNQGVSSAALLGGSNNPRPGEITLAHKGVLFLDELTEFKKDILNELRIPLEDRKVLISRVNASVEFPCDFMLVAATNPCRCGYYPDRRYCNCDEADVARYLSHIKGPLLDRVDICVGVNRIEADCLSNHQTGLSSSDMREKIRKAQEMQKERFKEENIIFNSQMSKKMTDKYCQLDIQSLDALKRAYEKFNMTARGWYKIIKVARTIADIDGSADIKKSHVLEAIGYRNSYISE